MKKTKRKIIYILSAAIIVVIFIIMNPSNQGSIIPISVEALASGENNKYDCDINPGFCIIDGIAQPGVTYKE